jgi:hypothetical protein
MSVLIQMVGMITSTIQLVQVWFQEWKFTQSYHCVFLNWTIENVEVHSNVYARSLIFDRTILLTSEFDFIGHFSCKIGSTCRSLSINVLFPYDFNNRINCFYKKTSTLWSRLERQLTRIQDSYGIKYLHLENLCQ